MPPIDTADLPRYAIRIAARRSGLTAAAIRAWERRYGAVRPERSGTERRLYSDADIERLRRLRELTERGHAIGRIATLTSDALASLLAAERLSEREAVEQASASPAAEAGLPESRSSIGVTLADCERALRELDGAALHRLLMRGLVEQGPERFISRLVAPLCRAVGDGWESGTLTVAHEHVASVALRHALGFLLETLRGAPGGPRLVATTPAGERHEFGAMMAAIVAAVAGWEAAYLGPDLPAADIGAAVRRVGARAVLLSVVCTRDGDDALDRELQAARSAVGDSIAIIAGGAGVPALGGALETAGILAVGDFGALREALDRLAMARPSSTFAA